MYHGSLALKARRTNPVATTINCEPAAANRFKSELAREFRAKDDEEKLWAIWCGIQTVFAVRVKLQVVYLTPDFSCWRRFFR